MAELDLTKNITIKCIACSKQDFTFQAALLKKVPRLVFSCPYCHESTEIYLDGKENDEALNISMVN